MKIQIRSVEGEHRSLNSTYDQLRTIWLHEKDGTTRWDLVMPDLVEKMLGIGGDVPFSFSFLRGR